ncbi:MAG: hypothetical protein IJH30_03380, partial [Bacillus sp. (in: Bacteria)]|nr:hypothetical protein [Bacillus sp. (in: firmicutes)]
QNEWNLAQWERENAYNSPIQQMQRYREAGLNPNLIYGQQNLSAASPSAAGANFKPVPKNNALGKFLQNLDIRNIMQEIDLKQAQKTLLESQAGYYQELQHNLGTRSEGQTLFNTYFGDPDNMLNLWKQNAYKTNIMGVEARDTQNRFDVDWLNYDPDNNPFVGSRRWYENNIVRVQNDKYELEYDLSNKYDAQMYQAQIYNLVHGNMAQQVSARGNLMSGSAAIQRVGLDVQKWNAIKDSFVRKYGADSWQAMWNAVYAGQRAFGNSAEQKLARQIMQLNKDKFSFEKIKFAIERIDKIYSDFQDNLRENAKILFK